MNICLACDRAVDDAELYTNAHHVVFHRQCARELAPYVDLDTFRA